MKDLAIIILNYNSSKDCIDCIRTLLGQERVRFEIIIVDNKSRIDELIKIREVSKKYDCTLIENKENNGYNAGNNIGLRYASSKGYKYALIANPDMLFPNKEYLMTLLSIIKSDSNIVACGSDIIGTDGSHQNPQQPDGNGFDSLNWLILYPINYIRKKKIDYKNGSNAIESRYCDKLSGCCILLKLGFIEDINYFDEKIFLYCEEAVFSKVVKKAGKKMYYESSVSAIHNHIENKKSNHNKRLDLWRKSRNYFIDNYSSNSWLGKRIEKISNYIYIELIKKLK